MSQQKTKQKEEEAQQPSTAQIVRSMKDRLAVIDDRAKEDRSKVFNMILEQLAASTEIINNQQNEIKRLQELCKSHKIDISPPKPKEVKLNRKQRRQLQRNAKKQKKKAQAK